ncbi:hypothetical protein BGZ67_010487, partial [Mortierella alpina]
MVKPITRSRIIPALASTADALPTEHVGNEPTVEEHESESMDVDRTHDDDLDYDEDADMIGRDDTSVSSSLATAGLSSPSTTLLSSPATVATPTLSDQQLLMRLHEEREALLEVKHATTRRLAANQATIEEAEAAALALQQKDRVIQLMKDTLQDAAYRYYQ